MATGDNLKSTKAIAATAGLICVGGSVVIGGVVQRVENKPKDV